MTRLSPVTAQAALSETAMTMIEHAQNRANWDSSWENCFSILHTFMSTAIDDPTTTSLKPVPNNKNIYHTGDPDVYLTRSEDTVAIGFRNGGGIFHAITLATTGRTEPIYSTWSIDDTKGMKPKTIEPISVYYGESEIQECSESPDIDTQTTITAAISRVWQAIETPIPLIPSPRTPLMERDPMSFTFQSLERAASLSISACMRHETPAINSAPTPVSESQDTLVLA